MRPYLCVLLLLAGCAQADAPTMPPARAMSEAEISEAGLIRKAPGVYEQQ